MGVEAFTCTLHRLRPSLSQGPLRSAVRSSMPFFRRFLFFLWKGLQVRRGVKPRTQHGEPTPPPTPQPVVFGGNINPPAASSARHAIVSTSSGGSAAGSMCAKGCREPVRVRKMTA